jgi:hypothetical protein
MPARIKPASIFSDEVAGPMVQTIFVRRIAINVHEQKRESTKENWSDGVLDECNTRIGILKYWNHGIGILEKWNDGFRSALFHHSNTPLFQFF